MSNPKIPLGNMNFEPKSLRDMADATIGTQTATDNASIEAIERDILQIRSELKPGLFTKRFHIACKAMLRHVATTLIARDA